MFASIRMQSLVAMLVFGLALAVAAAHAQVLYGSLTGNVSDQTGAIVPGIKVEASNNDTGLSKTLVTDERGSYLFNDLQVGVYKLTISAPSFQTFSRDNV